MIPIDESFQGAYRRALRHHLRVCGEESLVAGYDLGRRALSEGVSILAVTEYHFQVLAELAPQAAPANQKTWEAGLRFLLQTLAALDVATRGFLDRARGYQRQRARAEALEELAQVRARESAFRRGLVDSLQEGFFITDADATVTETNNAFAELTGYGSSGLPYRWPYPWIPEDSESRLAHNAARETVFRTGAGRFTLAIRRRDGQPRWVAVTAKTLVEPHGDERRRVFVGTLRDVTAEHVTAARERAAIALHEALSTATTVPEVLRAGLTALRALTGVTAAVAALWANHRPELYTARASGPACWAELDEPIRRALEHARLEPFPHVMLAATADRPLPGAALAMPLSASGDAALWVRFDDGLLPVDRSLLGLLTSQLAQALHRARGYEQARAVSLTLQHALLPHEELPSGFAVRYEPAERPLEVGGDWYDVLPLRGGLIGIVVGDCVGRGLRAAAVMGQLRSSCRALLLHGDTPGRVLDDLDAVARLIPDARCTTVCCATIAPATGVLCYSSAGHVPAILARAGQPSTLLDAATSVPLATVRRGPRPEAAVTVPAGSTLLLYTDGLIERRASPIDVGIATAAEVLAEAGERTPDELVDFVLRRLRPPAGYDDDVAVLAYRQPWTGS